MQTEQKTANQRDGNAALCGSCSDVRVYRSDFIVDTTGESLFDYLLSQLRIPEEKRETIDSVTFNGDYTTEKE